MFHMFLSVGHGEDESLHGWWIFLGWTQHGVVAGKFLHAWIASKYLELIQSMVYYKWRKGKALLKYSDLLIFS